LIKLWLDDCDDKHIDCRDQTQNYLPTRLIDVGTSEVPVLLLLETSKKKPTDTRYIALSHPWGDVIEHPPFRTLQKDPSGRGHEFKTFLKGIPYDQLPATFKDAVKTTRALGIRYLWIDSICIIQGDGGDFNQEAKRMEDVFSCAYCVLAASRATGQHDGFLKSQPQREYLVFQRNTEKPFYVCQPVDDFSHDVLEGSLNRRGWVLQERALARRTVFFTESQMYFECGSGVRCQTLTKMHK
jgi:Heterokaryon incompatibility protein (HET)